MCFGGVIREVMCVVVCVTKLTVPLGTLPPCRWMIYLLLVVLAALPTAVADNLGKQS